LKGIERCPRSLEASYRQLISGAEAANVKYAVVVDVGEGIIRHISLKGDDKVPDGIGRQSTDALQSPPEVARV
jgi:hypothetical protein